MKSQIVSSFIIFFTAVSWSQDVLIPGVAVNLSNKGIISLPAEVVNQKNVTSIDFSNNPYFDLPDSVKMLNVTSLDLSHTGINSWQIDKIGQAFPNLESLNLSYCDLMFIGSRLQTFGKLKELNLSNNKFEEIPSALQSIRGLTSLNLENNDISKGYSTLGYLWKLKTLGLSGNGKSSSEDILLAVSLNENLTKLSLDASNLSAKGVQFLVNSSITDLKLNGVDGELPSGFTAFQNLENLEISNSPKLLDTKNQLAALKKLEQLAFIQSAVPNAINKLSSVNKIEVELSGSLWNNALPVLEKNKALETLDISKSSYTDEDVTALQAALPSTEILTGKLVKSPEMKSNELPVIVEENSLKTTIDPNVPNVVTEKGTQFEIPQNAFLLPNGDVYSGPVDLQVKMYDNAFGMALEGVAMTYNENGKEELFSSNGMIDFRAKTPDGIELQPNPDQQIMVTMPNLQPNTPTELFTFVDSTNTWNRVPNSGLTTMAPDQELQRILDSINKVDFKSRVNITDITPVFHFEFKYERNDASILSISRLDRFGKARGTENFSEYYAALTGADYRIDTILDEASVKFLKQMSKNSDQEDMTDRYDRNTVPRYVSYTTIVPDLARDNYRLTFMAKDSVISYPITLYGESNMAVQRRFKNYEKERGDSYQKMNEHMENMKTRLDSLIAQRAEMMRNVALSQATQNYTLGKQNAEMLRFGLRGFGLVNCDFFSRSVPSRYVRVPKKVKNQNDEEVEIPADVRVIIPDENTYVGVSAESVPVYEDKKNYALFNLGANIIGVFAILGSTMDITTIRTYNIEGKSGDEVRKLINAE